MGQNSPGSQSKLVIKLQEIEPTSFKITERSEDYLRIIHKIINQQGFARTNDVALELHIKPASAFEMLAKLQKLNLVIHEKYGEVKLTRAGLSIAQAIKKRHDTFRDFLEILLVLHEIAIRDANILEHKLDRQTMIQFAKFVDFMTLDRPGVIKRWREIFKWYCDSKKQEQPKIVSNGLESLPNSSLLMGTS
jgi:Mn-dependent DtxR family transcriptional regulator